MQRFLVAGEKRQHKTNGSVAGACDPAWCENEVQWSIWTLSAV